MNNYCTDEITNIPCIYDIGSSISIFPNIYETGNKNSPVSWYNTTTNTSIKLLGTIYRDIKIGSKYYSWNFYIADIDQILLGSDFIAKHRL